jgi:hypothetical protein
MPTTQIQISTSYVNTGGASAQVALGQVGQEASKAEKQLLAYATATAAAQRSQGDAAGSIRTMLAALAQVGRESKDAVALEGQLATALDREAAAARKAADDTLRLAQAQARVAISGGDKAGASTILQGGISAAQAGGASQNAILGAQVQLNNALKEGDTLAQQFGQGIKSGLLGIVGPAALAAGAIAAVKGTVDSFVEAFKFKAELDQNTASITAQLKGVRDSSQAFAEARAFAEKYKLTQEDTTTAIQASVPLLRQSKASLTDVLTVLSQLQVLKPEQGIQGAAFALAELQGGQSRSLATRFNIPIAKATEMKNEIQKGGDAVQILGAYLDKAGISTDALLVRTKGAAGALNDAAIAAEKLKIAQAEFGQGPGTAIIQEETTLLTGLTRLLTGDFTTGVRAAVTNQAALTAAQFAYGGALNTGKTQAEAAAAAQQAFNTSIQNSTPSHQAYAYALHHGATEAQAMAIANRANGDAATTATTATLRAADADDRAAAAAQTSTNALSAEAQKKLDSSIASAKLADEQRQLDRDSQLAASGLLGAGNQAALLAQKYGIAGDAAQFLIDKQRGVAAGIGALIDAQTAATQVLTQPGGIGVGAPGITSGGNNSVEAVVALQEANKKAADQATKDAASLLDSEIALAGAKKDTAREIDLLRQKQSQLDRTTAAGQAEYNQIQAQIIGIQTAGGRKRVDAAASTALQLNNVEQNSQLQLAKTQREGLERLRDQEADFTLRRVRNKEDEDRKIRRLLAGGQIAAAKREREDFAIQQRRDQEDFNIQKQRTRRNNAEGTSDIDKRADLRQEQIGNRAALRGVKAGVAPAGPGAVAGDSTPLPAGTAGASAPAAATVIQVNVGANVNLDSQQVGSLIFDVIRQKLDDNFALELRSATPPGAGQDAVSGARP